MKSEHEVKVNLLKDLSEYYRTAIPVSVLEMYARDLVEVPLDQLRSAIEEYRTWPSGHDDFPRPAKLMPEYFFLNRPNKAPRPLTIVST